jgi:hypothetical protein
MTKIGWFAAGVFLLSSSVRLVSEEKKLAYNFKLFPANGSKGLLL